MVFQAPILWLLCVQCLLKMQKSATKKPLPSAPVAPPGSRRIQVLVSLLTSHTHTLPLPALCCRSSDQEEPQAPRTLRVWRRSSERLAPTSKAPRSEGDTASPGLGFMVCTDISFNF